MRATALSPATLLRVDLLFHPKDRAEAAQLLFTKCGNNLPFLENYDAQALERFQFAALKWSEGDLGRLGKAIDLAQKDWRDLLVAAEFADDVSEHERWIPPAR